MIREILVTFAAVGALIQIVPRVAAQVDEDLRLSRSIEVLKAPTTLDLDLSELLDPGDYHTLLRRDDGLSSRVVLVIARDGSASTRAVVEDWIRAAPLTTTVWLMLSSADDTYDLQSWARSVQLGALLLAKNQSDFAARSGVEWAPLSIVLTSPKRVEAIVLGRVDAVRATAIVTRQRRAEATDEVLVVSGAGASRMVAGRNIPE